MCYTHIYYNGGYIVVRYLLLIILSNNDQRYIRYMTTMYDYCFVQSCTQLMYLRPKYSSETNKSIQILIILKYIFKILS